MSKTESDNRGRLQRSVRLLCDLQSSAEQFRKERICTMGENSRNLHHAWGKYGLRGVNKELNGKWRARIRVNYKAIAIGTFDTERDAAIAYAFASKMFHGEFGSLPGHKKHSEEE